MSQATLKDNGTTNVVEALYVALELSKSVWKLAMSDGRQGGRPRLVDVPARDLGVRGPSLNVHSLATQR